MIVWVVALRPEAQPIIEARRLRPAKVATAWPLYLGEDGEALVVSGIGRSAAAAASGWTHGHLAPPAHVGWINAGIAGHSSGPVGRALIARRVVEPASDRSWFPPPLKGIDLEGDTLFTVDRPESSFAVTGAYDMEASGFLAAVGRWSTAELAQVVKIVSDTPTEPASRLDRKSIQRLVEGQMPALDEVATTLADYGERLAAREDEPPGYSELLGSRHFTVTQRRQLRRLLERHVALGGDRALTMGEFPTSREVLRELERQVDGLAVGGGS